MNRHCYACCAHLGFKEKGGPVPLSGLKLLKADPAQVQAQSEEIKARYAKSSGCDAGTFQGRK